MSHYYNENLEPCHKVKRTDGKGLRDTTVRDAKKNNWFPSVTTIFSLLNKDGLFDWKAEKVLRTALTKRQEVGEEWDKYVQRILNEAEKVQAMESGQDKGSFYHNLLEQYYQSINTNTLGKLLDTLEVKDLEIIQEVANTVFPLYSTLPLTEEVQFISEKTFVSTSYGYAGTIDLIINTDDTVFIIDFKSKNTTDLKKFVTYETHLMQLCAYQYGIPELLPAEGKKRRLLNILFSSIEPGIIKVKEWDDKEMEKGAKMFFALLDYWQYKNDYCPS